MADRWRPPLPDLGLAAVLVLFVAVGTGRAAEVQDKVVTAPAYALAVTAALSIVAWRRWPLWTFGLTGSATAVYIGLGYPYGPVMVTLGLAVYGLAARRPVRLALPAIAALLVASMTAVGVGIVTGERDWPEFVSMAAWLIIPAAVGVAIKVRRDAAADVRAEQARRAVSEERLHLAQEVHDVVGHSLAVIAMQAGVALRMLDRDSDRTRAALTAIRSASQEALTGLRAEVAALRQEPGWQDAPRAPSSGLADLPALAARMRASGLPINVETRSNVDSAADGTTAGGTAVSAGSAELATADRGTAGGTTADRGTAGAAAAGRRTAGADRGGAGGDPGEAGSGAGSGSDPLGGVPAKVDHAAYRIVQESLTNVLRHAGPDATAEVRITRSADALHLEVLDTGRGAAPATRSGHGIDGMRERAEALGGTLEAGPRPGGGFAVRARLPCPQPAPVPAGSA